MKRTLVISLGLALVTFVFAASNPAIAEKPIFMETYDISPVPCEGLQLDGITYSFSVAGVPSPDCTVGTSMGPDISDDIDPPNIEGTSAGVLHMRFDVPTTTFGFGVALATVASPQVNSVIVNLNRPGAGLLREEVFLTITRDPLYVGGQFDYDGPAVGTATIQFNGGPFKRFAIDNVIYFRPGGQLKK